MRWLALAAHLPTAATAQYVTFDITPTAQCVASSGGMSCAGLAASRCIEVSEGGYSTNGTSSCVDQELGWWDDRLNAVYGRLKPKLEAQDAQAPGYAPPQADGLLEMQRAWIPYRDAKCYFAATAWGGGTGAGPATLWCLLEETAAQTLYLEERDRETEAPQ